MEYIRTVKAIKRRLKINKMNTQTTSILMLTKPTKSVLSFCAYSETIRQFPENYCIASKKGGKWSLDTDLAAHPYFVAVVAIGLLNFENSYCSSGLKLLGNLTV